ncbi:phage portal protein [Marinobacter sp. BGYM27]|uniref:phage portal protein n=1 Tax=Marinobacter sp. BGYM27 TaxID=2975597 RepID=UPI0021A58714|nr:phage portal protein [Marinobacter sp. BGYM27]MDG5498962.1 phage portal protein [Marinobacter sp. BGYM27]
MSLFTAFSGFFRSPGAPPRVDGLQTGIPGGYGTTAAAEVSFDTAMQISPVWAAVKLISESIGSMPFNVYKVTDKGREIATDHPLHRVLTSNPNQYQTDVEFWESLALNLAISGNAYAIIQRSGSRIVGLLPVSSAQVETTLLSDGTVIHSYTSGANVKVYSSESMWHVKLFGNGIVGLSPLSYARNSIGIAIAADNRVSKVYSNGAKPSGILTIDKTLTKDQRTQVRSAFAGLEEGNEDKLFVLEAGMNYTPVSMSPQDIELLDSRRFQIEDIGRFFGVPSILLNQTFGQSSLGSNVYEILSAFYKLNLRPYLEKFEASVPRWLMSSDDASKHECEFDFDAALLRADLKTRMEANRIAINSGQSTPNEARISEGKPALKGGDKLLIQGAMVPIQQAGQKPVEMPNEAQES